MIKTVLLFCAMALLAALPVKAHSLGHAGTLAGTVIGHSQSSVSGLDGLTNIALNP